mgnify:CR=1 FL=1
MPKQLFFAGRMRNKTIIIYSFSKNNIVRHASLRYISAGTVHTYLNILKNCCPLHVKRVRPPSFGGSSPVATQKRQGGGHLVVVTSVGGLRGGGGAPAYNASKAYQMNYAEGLRQRAAKSRLPIFVTDIRPGLAATAMAKGEGLFWVMPVDKVADQLLRAVRRRRSVAVVTRRWRIVAWLLRHMPDRIYRKMG